MRGEERCNRNLNSPKTLHNISEDMSAPHSIDLGTSPFMRQVEAKSSGSGIFHHKIEKCSVQIFHVAQRGNLWRVNELPYFEIASLSSHRALFWLTEWT